MCLRLKTGFAQDKTLEDIIAEVELEEKADPPQPPSSDIDTLIPITAQRHIFQAPIHQTIEYAKEILTFKSRCLAGVMENCAI
eukprot:s105_g31.t1